MEILKLKLRDYGDLFTFKREIEAKKRVKKVVVDLTDLEKLDTAIIISLLDFVNMAKLYNVSVDFKISDKISPIIKNTGLDKFLFRK